MDLVSFDMRFLSFIRIRFLFKLFICLFSIIASLMREQRKRKFSCSFVFIGRIGYRRRYHFVNNWQNRLFHVCFSCVLKSAIVTNITLEEVLSKMNCNCMLWEKLWDFSPTYLFFMCFNNNLKTVIVTNMTLEHGLYKMNCKCVF